MKIYKNILIALLACFSTISCEKWLDVQPKSEIKQDKLFESESGFQEALMGVYVLMGREQLYGRELTVGMLDVVAQQYNMESTNSYYTNGIQTEYVGNSLIINVWEDMYRIIANINSILSEIDNQRHVLTATGHAVIKGEALALRAYLHFDLLRMFGWGNLSAPSREEFANRPAIPYVTTYHKDITKQHSCKEVLEFIEKDLLEAEILLNNYDPFSTLGASTRPADYSVSSDDIFYLDRKSRFNVWAVRATLVRSYMWAGDYEKAVVYADRFTSKNDGEKPYSTIKWTNPMTDGVSGVEDVDRDFKLLNENIFTLTCTDLYEGKIRNYIDDYIESGTNNSLIVNKQFFFFSEEEIIDRYGVLTEEGRGDWRYNFFKLRIRDSDEDYVGERYLCMKFQEVTGIANANLMPLIKLSEMFYCAAECHLRLGNMAEAADAINTARLNRGISGTLSESDDLLSYIVSEYYKEFINEGVMFYLYKRLNMPIPNATMQGDDVFVFPIPDSELDAGREDNVVD